MLPLLVGVIVLSLFMMGLSAREKPEEVIENSEKPQKHSIRELQTSGKPKLLPKESGAVMNSRIYYFEKNELKII